MPKKIKVARNEGMTEGLDIAGAGTDALIAQMEKDLAQLDKPK